MCESCDFQPLLDSIEEMLNDDDHRWAFASDTLLGIQETVESRGHATEAQKQAVNNIHYAVRGKNCEGCGG